MCYSLFLFHIRARIYDILRTSAAGDTNGEDHTFSVNDICLAVRTTQLSQPVAQCNEEVTVKCGTELSDK